MSSASNYGSNRKRTASVNASVPKHIHVDLGSICKKLYDTIPRSDHVESGQMYLQNSKERTSPLRVQSNTSPLPSNLLDARSQEFVVTDPLPARIPLKSEVEVAWRTQRPAYLLIEDEERKRQLEALYGGRSDDGLNEYDTDDDEAQKMYTSRSPRQDCKIANNHQCGTDILPQHSQLVNDNNDDAKNRCLFDGAGVMLSPNVCRPSPSDATIKSIPPNPSLLSNSKSCSTNVVSSNNTSVVPSSHLERRSVSNLPIALTSSSSHSDAFHPLQVDPLVERMPSSSKSSSLSACCSSSSSSTNSLALLAEYYGQDDSSDEEIPQNDSIQKPQSNNKSDIPKVSTAEMNKKFDQLVKDLRYIRQICSEYELSEEAFASLNVDRTNLLERVKNKRRRLKLGKEEKNVVVVVENSISLSSNPLTPDNLHGVFPGSSKDEMSRQQHLSSDDCVTMDNTNKEPEDQVVVVVVKSKSSAIGASLSSCASSLEGEVSPEVEEQLELEKRRKMLIDKLIKITSD